MQSKNHNLTHLTENSYFAQDHSSMALNPTLRRTCRQENETRLFGFASIFLPFNSNKRQRVRMGYLSKRSNGDKKLIPAFLYDYPF